MYWTFLNEFSTQQISLFPIIAQHQCIKLFLDLLTNVTPGTSHTGEIMPHTSLRLPSFGPQPHTVHLYWPSPTQPNIVICIVKLACNVLCILSAMRRQIRRSDDITISSATWFRNNQAHPKYSEHRAVWLRVRISCALATCQLFCGIWS